MHYHDKKTVHTSPQNYRDMDGNMRTFTHIDHDKKPSVSIPSDGTNPKEELKKYRASVIEKILNIYAGYCPTVFMEYTIRGQEQVAIKWDESMLRDEGTPLDRLTQLYTLASNTEELNSRKSF